MSTLPRRLRLTLSHDFWQKNSLGTALKPCTRLLD
jgi:hypothetical protein